MITGGEMSDNLIAKPKIIHDLFGLDLVIPEYQRPYKWSRKHVLQLVDDLIFHQNKSCYRIGTVVLHKDETKNNALNIVDGQQRTVTLCLILHALGETNINPLMIVPESRSDEKVFNTSLLNNAISRKNIQNNYATIKQRLEDVDKDKLKTFILEKCEVVKVVLTDLSEAFQFFDSQNARGKSLEHYDLLKAFHLREMEGSTDGEKKDCVEKWEKAIENQELKPLFNEYLYRIRQWVRGKPAFYFTRNDVELFKGISFSEHNKCTYPYAKALEATSFLADKYQGNPFMTLTAYPFQIDQVMINGKRFFEYIEYYRECLSAIKKTKHDCFNIINHKDYKGKNRTGDKYTRNLFQAALLYYIDKFGDDYLDQAVNAAFFWAYSIRLENTAVRLATMDNKACGDRGMFKVIAHAVHPKEVLSFPYHKAKQNNATKVEKIAGYFGIEKKEDENE